MHGESVSLRARCSAEDREVELAGDQVALLDFARLLTASDLPVELELVADDDPAPYERALTTLTVSTEGGALRFEVSGSEFIVGGGREQRRTLANNIEWFATHQDPSRSLSHMHIEHLRHPEHYIAADSVPVVLTFM